MRDDGGVEIIGKTKYLPASVILTTNENQSPPLQQDYEKDATDEPTAIDLPGYGKNYRYVVLRFRANGQLDSDLSNNWFVTICRKTLGEVKSEQAGDFITIKIDPISGRTTSYRQ